MCPANSTSRRATRASRPGTSASHRASSFKWRTRSPARYWTPVAAPARTLFSSPRGQRVTGIDFLEQPIAEATRKAHKRGLDATFLVMDALRLEDLPEVFDSAIDCGLFHVFSDEDRANYVASLSTVVKPGGRLFLACFSDKEPPGEGPRRVTQQELRDAFSGVWRVESIREARFDVRTDLPDLRFSPGGPYAWFCVVRRL